MSDPSLWPVQEVSPGRFEFHRQLPATRMSRVDMQELLGTLTEPSVADGLLVYAGFHVRLEAGEVSGDSPATIAAEEIPAECTDVFLTVDFGDREHYQRQVLVVFEPHQAAVSVTGNDAGWVRRIGDDVAAFAQSRRAWFRHHGFLQRLLLIAGMAVVTVAAGIGNFGGSELRWVGIWLFVTGVTLVAASALVPGQLRYSVVSLASNDPPGNSARENAVLFVALVAFSVTVVGTAIATLLAITS